MTSWISTESCLSMQNNDQCHIKMKNTTFSASRKKNPRLTHPPLGICESRLAESLTAWWICGRSAALCLTAWPTFVLTSLVWFLFLLSDCWRQSWVIKRTVTEGLWSFLRETVERSGETVGSLLLEIVIMSTLWYLGYWEHTFKSLILRAVIRKFPHSLE